ncbi:protein O-GlcNAcase [Brevibacillus migulae]|uniref:protein O-GlcNAcase n=1 Tax=Brevibacillus migulae TaxID=1644114 RepID=UPI00106EC250|nr:protein O-GlcNAcase [Brevibacillus migulae]
MNETATFAIRGVIEGFYGTPWSQEERLAMIHFLASHGYNAYFYAPKDDPYLRERWQEPHPTMQLANIVRLAEEAREGKLDFYYCLSPGLDMRYSREEDFSILLEKFRQMFSAGIRHFGLFFDDIPMTLLHEDDLQCYDSLATAHADVTLRFWRQLQSWSDENRLVICPTLYNGLGNEPYIVELGRLLPQEIMIFWTGRFVCSPYLTEGDAAKFVEWTGHRPLYWDNYPVNDLAMANELHIGPLLHRDPALYRHAHGYVANAMELVESSKIPLITTGHYLSNPEGYDPEKSWKQAIREIAGEQDAEAFQLFADNVRSSFLNEQESPRLLELFLRFRSQFLRGDQKAAVSAVKKLFQEMEATAVYLLHRMHNKKLASEVERWVEKYRRWAKVGQATALMVESGIRGRTPLAVFYLLLLKYRLARAEKMPQRVCGSVMRLFVDAILQEVKVKRDKQSK